LLFPLISSAETLPGVARFGQYSALLRGKRVGLVVNQASLHKGVHTIDFLLSKGVRVVKLFALEHGVRGEGGAGEEIGDSVDEKTGLPIVSLYGARKKPDDAALSGVDIIVYDIQDVGVRFFTYISSLGLIMEAAAEHRISVLVLDRPNPNGDYVEGPTLKPDCRSFVGAFPIPVVYGMTPGELARMIQGERWQASMASLDLHVASLSGYDRRSYSFPENRPSPGLRSLQAIRAYPSLALFEPSIVSLGRGTEHPFTQYGIPGEPIGPASFTPHFQPKDQNKLYDGELCHGEEFYSLAPASVPRFTTDIFVRALGKVKRRPFLTNPRFLELLVGDKRVVSEMLAGKSYAEIRVGFEGELSRFIGRRRPYLLY
jgi:uncharacterized protein YbbC (DUF1343 family)